MQDVDGKELKWETLEHSGVLFPPEYKAHGVKMLYDGAPVELTEAQEEVATMAASMVETDYFSKDTFLKNFWEGFKKVGACCGAAARQPAGALTLSGKRLTLSGTREAVPCCAGPAC